MTKRFNCYVDWKSFQFSIGMSKLDLHPEWKYVVSLDFAFLFTYFYICRRTNNLKTTNHGQHANLSETEKEQVIVSE